MAELNARDAKLIQYLNEAHSKEKELETSLQAHIGMTTRPPYKKRLQQHLKETKSHSKQLERRIKKIGGTTAKVPELASKGVALAKGPLHMLRGTGEEEKLLKNAKTQYSEEHEEIATYRAIEAMAETLGDKETAKLARAIRRDEERMASYLERLLPTLTKAVARAEVPAAERNGSRRRGSTRKRSSSARKGTGSARKSTGTRRKGSSSARKRTGSSSSSRRRSSSSSSSRRRSTRSRR